MLPEFSANFCEDGIASNHAPAPFPSRDHKRALSPIEAVFSSNEGKQFDVQFPVSACVVALQCCSGDLLNCCSRHRDFQLIANLPSLSSEEHSLSSNGLLDGKWLGKSSIDRAQLDTMRLCKKTECQSETSVLMGTVACNHWSFSRQAN